MPSLASPLVYPVVVSVVSGEAVVVVVVALPVPLCLLPLALLPPLLLLPPLELLKVVLVVVIFLLVVPFRGLGVLSLGARASIWNTVVLKLFSPLGTG